MENTTVFVSRHARERVRERLGVPRRSVQRTAQLAWDRGQPMTQLRVQETCGTAGMNADTARVHGGFVFLFAFDHQVLTLVTVLHLEKPRPLQRPAGKSRFDRLAWRRKHSIVAATG